MQTSIQSNIFIDIYPYNFYMNSDLTTTYSYPVVLLEFFILSILSKDYPALILLSPHFLLLFPYPVSKGGRVVQGGSLRYCSLRRRGFEPHPLHFVEEFFMLILTISSYSLLLYPCRASQHSRQCAPLVRERSRVRFPQGPFIFLHYYI